MEFPHLVELQQKYRDRGLEVVVLTDEPASDLRAEPTLAAAPLTLIPDAAQAFRDYKIKARPHTIFFDAAGEVRLDFTGYTDALPRKLEKLIEAAAPGRSATQMKPRWTAGSVADEGRLPGAKAGRRLDRRFRPASASG